MSGNVYFDKGLHGLRRVDVYPPGEGPGHDDISQYTRPFVSLADSARVDTEPPHFFKHYVRVEDAKGTLVADGFTTHKNPKKAEQFLLDLANATF